MSNDAAKDLLAQADRLIKKAHTRPDDLPVLTDFVAPPAAPSAPPPVQVEAHGASSAASRLTMPEGAETAAGESLSLQQESVRSEAASSLPPDAIMLTRSQFDERVAQKLEELQHVVFNQVMRQLDLHAAGNLKSHLRASLLPPLAQIADEIASQVADETSRQIRDLVGEAIAAEMDRLRGQLSKPPG